MCEDLVEIGVKSRKEIIKYIPAKLIVEEHVIYSYACKSFEKETGESNIVSTEMPRSIFYNSMASNELMIMVKTLSPKIYVSIYEQYIF